jgi:hypothetical protein
MEIGILGAGMVGGALTKALAKRGHSVLVSASDPASPKLKALVAEAGSAARAATNEEAAKCDIVILATPWGATKKVLKSLDLSGRIVLDATNPIAADFSGLERGFDDSGGESVARWAKGARVVKALNQIGADLMDAPKVKAGRPVMFIAGDDADAKAIVASLVESLGFDVDDCGGLQMSRHLEPLAWLWINRAMRQNRGRNFALVLSSATP